ncbi:hypothetical protein [Pseudomonas sp. RIT-To-2]|uniref:hypothetical protein n=1 Tax=Pseudomonas sp. RIT-To-2 TaxID=3462541 RepID=UPI0024139A91
MIRPVTLNVSFPRFGKNYYVQNVVTRKAPLQLITNDGFGSVLMPQASHHFSNEVVGLNDQFRFLNNILVAHLLGPRANAHS